jgi:hypothetical protein
MMGKYKWHTHSKPPKGISSLRPREYRDVTKELRVELDPQNEPPGDSA